MSISENNKIYSAEDIDFIEAVMRNSQSNEVTIEERDLNLDLDKKFEAFNNR